MLPPREGGDARRSSTGSVGDVTALQFIGNASHLDNDVSLLLKQQRRELNQELS
jgi:hypothetical protein